MGLDMFLDGKKFFIPQSDDSVFTGVNDLYKEIAKKRAIEDVETTEYNYPGFVVKDHKIAKTKLEDGFVVKEHILELGYWRKHPNLHGYIVQNFAAGVDECQSIHLSEEQLEKLIEAVTKNELIPTTGFFFGKSPEDSAKYDIPILKKALKWLKASKKGECRDVVYHASW